ncbi:unnamed protein product [Cuscuta campestris]|uniref:Retrotransposon gag domain-containing protein n=1 Tax=Cuscuta campestris TaxID=132261 RepID=A0A484MRM9_9ASTE|nr:unnamed protein product [Cuscuta campestris]
MPKPTDPAELEACEANNSIICSWIFNSVDELIQSSIASHTVVHELWSDLKTCYSTINEPQIYQWENELQNLRQKGQTVVVYYNQFVTLWNKLYVVEDPTCGCVCPTAATLRANAEKEKTRTFLLGLDDEQFGTLRGQILGTQPLADLNKDFYLITQEERHRSVVRARDDHTDAMAFAAPRMANKRKKKKVRGAGKCEKLYKRRREGHPPIELEWERGELVHGLYVLEFTELVGFEARLRVPITYNNWHDVPKDVNATVVDGVWDMYLIPPGGVQHVMTVAGLRQRAFRTYLRGACLMEGGDHYGDVVHGVPLLPQQVKVSLTLMLPGMGEYTIPCPTEHIEFVIDCEGIGSFVAWPNSLVGLGDPRCTRLDMATSHQANHVLFSAYAPLFLALPYRMLLTELKRLIRAEVQRVVSVADTHICFAYHQLHSRSQVHALSRGDGAKDASKEYT